MREVLIIPLIVVILFTGCKPQEKIIERVVTQTDSTSLFKLQERVIYQTMLITSLERSLDKVKTEIINLKIEQSQHEIKYDTNAPINPRTGQYPKASETFSSSKQNTESSTHSSEKEKSEMSQNIQAELKKVADLEAELAMLKDENKKLKSKATIRGINYKVAIICFVLGLIIPILFIFRKKIRKILVI